MSVIYGNPITLGGGSKAPAIFGDGSDGVGLFTSDTTWLADTEDTGMIVKNFESLTISEGVTVSAGNRNCGMIIRVKGDCTISGTLANKMAPKTILDSDGVDFSVYPASMLSTKAGYGGDGGYGGVGYNGSYVAKPNGGVGQGGRFYGGGIGGGGGGGNAYQTAAGGAGGDSRMITTAVGSLFVGGAGTNSVGNDYSEAGHAGTYGGGGGGAVSGGGGSTVKGGAGGSGAGANGSTVTSRAGAGGGAGNYGGGVIILLVGGNLTITGTVNCSGQNGGKGGNNTQSTQYNGGSGGGGGGGGGGRIFICHKGTLTNSGTLNVNGGTGGAAGTIKYTYGQSCVGAAGTAGAIGTTAVKTYEQYMEEDVA